MAHAERCPVCGGSGNVSPPHDPNVTSVPIPSTCHACHGMGWVTVYDSTPYVPYVPTPPIAPPNPWWNPYTTWCVTPMRTWSGGF